MKEHSFILPWTDNEGKPLPKVHEELKGVLCGTFGGYSSQFVLGGYMKGCERIDEKSIKYIVAFDEKNSNLRQAFYTVAEHYAREANQQSVYIVDSDSVAIIVELDQDSINDTQRPNGKEIVALYDKAAGYCLSGALVARQHANRSWDK